MGGLCPRPYYFRSMAYRTSAGRRADVFGVWQTMGILIRSLLLLFLSGCLHIHVAIPAPCKCPKVEDKKEEKIESQYG